jgi:hypothetical protein
VGVEPQRDVMRDRSAGRSQAAHADRASVHDLTVCRFEDDETGGDRRDGRRRLKGGCRRGGRWGGWRRGRWNSGSRGRRLGRAGSRRPGRAWRWRSGRTGCGRGSRGCKGGGRRARDGRRGGTWAIPTELEHAADDSEYHHRQHGNDDPSQPVTAGR